MSFELKNIKYHPKNEYYAKDFTLQEGYSFTYSIRNGELLIETGAYLHWKDNEIFGIAIDISSMSGCTCKCMFCASANFYKGTLNSAEIVEQALVTLQYIQEKRSEFFNACNLLTFAYEGMGEPSLPLVSKQVVSSIFKLKSIFSNSGKRLHFMISTSGINTSVIRKWADEKIPLKSLQLSVHAVSENLRKLLLGENHLKIDEIIKALSYFHKKNPKVIIKINYLMLKINEISNLSKSELDLLIALLDGTGFLLKLSYLNITKPALLNNITSLSQIEIQQGLNYIQNKYPSIYIYGTRENLGISCGQIASYIK